MRAQIRKDIFRAFHRKSGIPVFFLDFLIDRVIRTIIRHSCRFDNNILLICGLLTAAAISAADTTGTTFTNSGGVIATGPVISVTSAPRRMQFSAIA